MVQDRPALVAAGVIRSSQAPGLAVLHPDVESGEGQPIELRVAMPYHAWANRGPGAMRVWLPHRRRA